MLTHAGKEVYLEFSATDVGDGDVVEAGIDDVSVTYTPDLGDEIGDIGVTPDGTNGIRSNTVTLEAGFNEPTGETDLDPTFPPSTVVTRADTVGGTPNTITYNSIDTIAPNNDNRFQGDDAFAQLFEIDAIGYGTNLLGFCLEFAEPANSGTFTPANASSAAPFFNSSYQSN